MSRPTYTIEIDRPVDEVFRYLDTSELAIKWLSGLTKITPITTGGNRVGAQAKHIYNENGREFEMLEETLIYEPNRCVKIKGITDMFEITAQYTLTGEGLTVAKAGGTMMACDAGVMQQESLFLDVLRNVRGFDLREDGALVLRAGDGRTIIARR